MQWQLSVEAQDADISPDDRTIAMTHEAVKPAERYSYHVLETVELWDFRAGHRIATAEVADFQSPRQENRAPIRFTSDQALLVVGVERSLIVTDAHNLGVVRKIVLRVPDDYKVAEIETSPIDRSALVIAASGSNSSFLFYYNLDSEQILMSWGPVPGISALAWAPNGIRCAVAQWNTIFVFDAQRKAIIATLNDVPAASVAFSRDRLFAVADAGYRGAVFHRRLKMAVFDAGDWKRLKDIALPRGQIHSSVSAVGNEIVANTGDIRTTYDWTDGVAWSTPMAAKFTVWDESARAIIYSSPSLSIKLPAMTGFVGVGVRFSRTGRLVLVNSRRPWVFELVSPPEVN